MEQNRSENSTSQQQNVHLHMHHVCNCQGNVFPTYYPAVGYRTPVPPLVTYQAPPVPRSYLQHYQYTQFNMGSAGQYSVPITHHVAPPTSTAYNPATAQTGPEVAFSISRERKEKAGSQEGNGDGSNDGIGVSGYDYTQVTPPASELLLSDNSEPATPENFVKFLERSCLTAEQIAYRNRNRPCFRNIQNLCIRTRSEILKPCTTISNIHSQGIPWATKDFIYAFVRLTNCWHILKGYWENRDGSSLGKIEKELTPEFRACYVRWEKETIELAAQLTRVFYNLDTNLVSPQNNSVKTSPPDVGATKKCQTPEENSISSSTLTNISINNPAKNVRGIIHLPPTPVVTETVDQGNQTYSADFCKDEAGYDSEEERRVYMKPGSYSVPKKESNESGNTTSPRGIEFLETAQNIKKAHTMGNDRYWSNVGVSSRKPSGDVKIVQDIAAESELELNLTTHMNVHEWILSSNFSDFGEQSPTSTQDLRPFFADTPNLYERMPTLEAELQRSTHITVLQRAKVNAVANEDPSTRAFASMSGPNRSLTGLYETPEQGITPAGTVILENFLSELNKYNIIDGLDAVDIKIYAPVVDIETVLKKVQNNEYTYVNQVVRDLRYLLNYYDQFSENFDNNDNKKKELVSFITEMFTLKLRDFLVESFPDYDFDDIKGDVLQTVGPLKRTKYEYE